MISSSINSDFPDLVHPKNLDVKKEVFLDWGPSFQIWHDSWWDPRDSIDVSVDTARLILHFIDIPNTWAIVTESVAYTFEKIHPIKISSLLNSPPPRICYTIKHRNPLTRNKKSLLAFESYLKEFIISNKFLNSI